MMKKIFEPEFPGRTLLSGLTTKAARAGDALTNNPALVQAIRGGLPWLLLGLGIVLWLISLPGIEPEAMTDIGLLSVLPYTFYPALGLLTISYCWTAFRQPHQKAVLLLHLVALILILHGTPSIVYGTLRYSWAWKHVGIIDFIHRHHQVDPNIWFLDAYHNWPGFFAVNTLLTEAAGLDSALGYARWGPVFFNLLFLGALYFLHQALTPDLRLAWMATWFFFLASWVGQDYFAPQAFTYFFYLVILGILFHWFRSRGWPSRPQVRRRSGPKPLRRFFHWVTERTRRSEEAGHLSRPLHRVISMAAVILMMIAVTSSHQLTPWLLSISLLLLVLFRRLSTRSLPVLMVVLALAWALGPAFPFVSTNTEQVTSSLGTPGSNIQQNIINLDQASPGQVIVSLVGRGLTVLVLVLGLLGFFRRLLNGYVDLSAILLIMTPLPSLMGISYGGEILFRVYFFALPFLVFFIGALFYPNPDRMRSWLTPIAAILVSAVMLAGFLFAYYGKENQYYFSQEEVAASEYLYRTAPPGSLIVEGTENYPTLFRDYEYFKYVPIDREPVETRQTILDQPVEVLSRWMGNPDYPAAYLIITRTQKEEIDTVGYIPRGSLDRIEQTLLESGQFEVLFRNRDAAIFVLKERRRQ